MSAFSQTTVNPSATGPGTLYDGLGYSNSAVLQEMFPTSPMHGASPTLLVTGEPPMLQTTAPGGASQVDAVTLLNEGVVAGSSGYYGFNGNFDRDYANAPDIAAGISGGGPDGTGAMGSGAGASATPYVPNPLSPGEGNGTTANSVPATPATVVNALTPTDDGGGRTPNNSFPSSGGGYATNPSTTSAAIAALSLGSYGLGSST